MNLRKKRTRVFGGVAAALSAALVLGACGGAADRAAAPAETERGVSEVTPEVDPGNSEDAVAEAPETPDEVLPGEASAEAPETPDEVSPSESATGDAPVGLRGSKATYVTVENRLQDWWGGDGIPITWRVTETQNRYWDGASRPDHAPPKGLQGLVQNADSGQYRVRLEVNTTYEGQNLFALTPVASVDGEQVALSPITFEYWNTQNSASDGDGNLGWNLSSGGRVCKFDVTARDPTQVQSFTYRTPRGDLAYDVVLKCPRLPAGPAGVLIRNYQRQ